MDESEKLGSEVVLCGVDVREKLKRLIRLPSTTPPIHVMPVVHALERFACDIGAQAVRQTVQPGKPNCLITLDFGGPKTLALNTHMDVNNPSGQVWMRDPFTPSEEDGRIYGLGACDAKGSLAAMLTALESVARRPQGIRGKIVLTAVMGEEAGGLGSLHLAQQGFSADGAIVGEPTQLALCTVHKGTYMRRLTFTGVAVHSARSRCGINAIHHAARFCVLYEELARTLASSPHPILGPADASVTLISGGTRQNTIPERCSVLIDRRLLPGETHEKADRELAALLDALRQEIPELNVDTEIVVATVPSEVPSEAEIVRCALSAISEQTGRQAMPQGFCGGCDMSKLVNIAHIPTAIFGPGSMENAHSPDEFVEISQLETASRVYERIIRRFLSGTGEEEGHERNSGIAGAGC